MGIFSRKPHIGKADFASVVTNLSRSLESLREEFVFGSLSQLKREGIDVSRISRDIVPGSDLEDALKGFQLTSVIGLAWNYISDIGEQLEFSKLLSSSLGAAEGSRAWQYHDKYLDCQGDLDALSKSLAVDIYIALGSPEPRSEFLIQFQGGGRILIGLCQLATCTACGDDKIARTIRKQIGLP